MDWGTFLRREWGAALFVLTVIVGLVAVPAALYFNGQRPAAAVAVTTPTATPTAASAPRVATSAAISTPSPSPSASPSR